ncbi:MAG TPA: glycosyltransferase, partial [Deltaproteobacteria bacterium]|nr:glycosyltransferase [Deltaproteobacteria bacterium]
SSDGTRDFLKGLENVKVILNNKNKGFSKATNQGIKLARGEYIVFLNPDTVVTWDWAWHMMLHFNEGVGAVGPVSNYAAGLQRYELYMKDKSLGEIDVNKLAEKLYTWNTGKSMETKLLTGFCMMTKKEILGEVGMLDEDLFLGSDDLEFSWRLREKGYRLVVATDTFIYHKAQASFATEPEEKMKRLTQESQDTLYLKLQKYYGKGKVPSSKELWGMDWFRPSNKLTRPSPPLTSIIMLTFNQLDYTRKCLQSIEKYTRSRYELILVDNGSTDGTVKFLKDYAKKHANVELILNKENLGFAKGNNQGIEKARGDYILLLNNDVVVTEGWLERMVDYMESNPDVGMVGPLSNNVSGPQKVGGAPSGSNLDDIHAFARRIARENADKAEDVMRLVGFCLLIRKDVIDLIGPLDENYGSGNFEDDDLCLRSLIAGFRHVILKDVFIHHYGSKTFEGNNIDYNSSLDKNRDYFARKWHGIVEMEDGSYKVKLEPKDRLDALISMGEMEHEMGRLNSAVNIFKKALMLDPLNSRVLNDLGAIQWELGERESAINTFQKAL